MKTLHVIPVGCGEPVHRAGLDCWCHPNPKPEGSGVIATHNAKDCREKMERQGFVKDGSEWVVVEGGV